MDIPEDLTASTVLPRLLNVRSRADSLVASIAETVARDIVEGTLTEGADLNSVELAKRFSTSRTPVREALMLLEREGLVNISARKRPRVAVLEIGQVQEIYRLRAALYSMVAARVAEQAPAADLLGMRQDLARMGRAADAADVTSMFWANVSFHERASNAAGDLTLKRTLDSLGVQVLRLRHHSLSLPGRAHHSFHDHIRLLQAYEENDADLASALARSIVVTAFNAMNHQGKSIHMTSRTAGG